MRAIFVRLSFSAQIGVIVGGLILFAMGAFVLFVSIRRINVMTSCRRCIRNITGGRNKDTNKSDGRAGSDSSGEYAE